MKKPLGIIILGLLYLVLGLGVIVAYIYLLVTDYSLFSFGSYNAGDVLYSAAAAEWIVKFALAPSIFLGGIFAVPGAVLILTKEERLGEYGYYSMIIASAIWSLPIIGLLAISFLLKDNIKELYLN